MTKKKPLSETLKAECDAAMALFVSKKNLLRITQARIAAEADMSPAAVAMFLNGTNALNAKFAAVFSRMIDEPVERFSPRLASEIKQLAKAVPGEVTQADSYPITAESEIYAHIPQKTARAAAGRGHENPHVEVRGTLAFKKSWLAYKGLKEKNLEVIYADGDSMSPTISNGDVLLIDKSRNEPADGQVFALNGADGAIVKRLKKNGHGQWALISDNLDKRTYPDQWLADSDGNEMKIIGRVVWRGGDL